MKGKTDFDRIQFDLTKNETQQLLDKVAEKVQARTRAEVIREALALFKWAVRQRAENRILLSSKHDLTEIREFTSSLLENVE